ncbi:metallophosphoesterase family protein [Salegentibacter sp. HM20]
MKLICVADTHNQHQALQLPYGDVLIHAGDFSDHGNEKETRDFINWLAAQPHPYKIFIGGNHDFYLENPVSDNLLSKLPKNVFYLKDSGITINGFEFWGSPYTPVRARWAFSRERGPDIRKHWEKIPESTQVLITHSPAYGILDNLYIDGRHVGCEELATQLKRIQPKIHVFGHIHEAHGSSTKNGITHINACYLDHRYRIMNKPIQIQL